MGNDRDLWSRYWLDSITGGCTEAFPDDARVRIANALRARLAAASGEQLLDGAEGAITGGVDARALPFLDANFDVVVSQFGVEYAGLDAAALEAPRICRGTLILLVHAAEGIVARQAAEQAAQVAGLDESRALERLRDHCRAPSPVGGENRRATRHNPRARRAHQQRRTARGRLPHRDRAAGAADSIRETNRLARDLADHATGLAVTITDEGLPPIGRWLDAQRY